MTSPEQPVDAVRPHDGHVRLLAGTSSSGEPVYEVIPAAPVSPGVYEVLGSPGLAYGCAAGDRIRVGDDGRFEVVARGGNLCLVAYPRDPIDEDAVGALRSLFARFDGLVEAPADRRFVVVTVPMTAGFAAVEGAVEGWAARHNAAWYFGNVYDENDRPLEWWETS